jgi:hypothetical protein
VLVRIGDWLSAGASDIRERVRRRVCGIRSVTIETATHTRVDTRAGERARALDRRRVINSTDNGAGAREVGEKAKLDAGSTTTLIIVQARIVGRDGVN